MPQEWEIYINRFRGFSPRYYSETYPSYGNKDQAGAMQNMSLLNPNVLGPGPGMAELTNGDQGGVVTTLIRGILRYAVASDTTYAFGGALLHKLSNTAVASGGSPSWPRTVNKAAVTGETGEDVALYQGKLYYSYNHSGAAGDIGQYDLSSTFDDDYYSAAATSGAALQDAPHQLLVGGDDILYAANGPYIASLNVATANDQALNFHTDSEISSISWNNNRIISAVNRPNLSGTNFNQSAIYKWNGYSSSWEGDPIEINGRIGALFTKNGITYIWYELFIGGSSRLVFGYLTGGQVVPLRTFSGSLPLYYQVGEIGDYLVWGSSSRIYAYGPLTDEVAVDMFQLMSPQYTNTLGGIGAPFGTLLVASNDGSSNYSLEKESGYETDANYKTILYETSIGWRQSEVKYLELQFDKLATGAEADIALVNNAGTTVWSDTVSFASDGAVTKKVFRPNATCENFRLEISHSDGSATNPVNIRKAVIKGINMSQ